VAKQVEISAPRASDQGGPSDQGQSDQGPSEPAQPSLTVSAVARRLGIEPTTLRTWHRRYGLGPSQHDAGKHRRYTASDLERLEAMRRLVQSGVAPADAARQVVAGPAEHSLDSAVQSLRGPAGPSEGPLAGPADGPLDGAVTRGIDADSRTATPDVRWDRPARDRPGGPGGRVLSAGPGAPPVSKGLARAAAALDGRTVAYLIDESIAQRGPTTAWLTVVAPLLASVGTRWESDGSSVELEHLLSDIAGAAFRRYALWAPEPAHGRPILLACVPGEEHNLPMAVLAAALAEELGVGSRLLGAGMPAASLGAAVRRTGPAVVVVWALLAKAADPAVFAALPASRPAPVFVAAGPGWEAVPTPPKVVRVSGLHEAVDAVRAALPEDTVVGAGQRR